MRKSLRLLMLGVATACSLGSILAQAPTPTVTLKWINQAGFTGDVRGGNGFGGKVYLADGAKIVTVDSEGASTFFTASGWTPNKGFAMDDAGNIMTNEWLIGGFTYKFRLIKADGSEVKEITVVPPTNDPEYTGRADLYGRAVGDFFSEEGGVFFLYSQNKTYPIPIWIANGEQKLIQSSTSVEGVSANSMAMAVPSFDKIEDMDPDNVQNQFYAYSGSKAWQIWYPNNGQSANLAEPKTNMPSGWGSQTQNGFEVFSLGGKTYIVRMSGNHAWGSNFLIHDEDGNTIFSTDYSSDYDSSTSGSGCGLFARKVSDYRVELYQIYKGALAQSFAAMYEITIPPERKAFAYGLSVENNADDKNLWDFTYNVNSNNVSAAELVLTFASNSQEANGIELMASAEEQEYVVELPKPHKGENKASCWLDFLPQGNYNWNIRLTGNYEEAEPSRAFSSDPSYSLKPSWAAAGDPTYSPGGVVYIRDTEAESFGYVVVGHGYAQGFEVYNPEGELQHGGPILVENSKLKVTSAGGNSPIRGDAFGKYAAFASWKSANAGVYLIDPMSKTADPSEMFTTAGATLSGGKLNYGGSMVACETPVVAFLDQKKMMIYGESMSYTVALYDFANGVNNGLLTPPTQFEEAKRNASAGPLMAQQIDIEMLENGFFVAQNTDSFTNTTPGLFWYDYSGKLLWSTKDMPAQDYQSACSAGVAVSPDRSLIAVSGKDEVCVYDLEFEGNTPVLTIKYTIPEPSTAETPAAGNGSQFMQLVFDNANNLHVFNRDGGGYRMFVLPGESKATTPAKADSFITVEPGNQTGADDVWVEDFVAAPEFYNLQGIRVSADNLTPGIYIRRQGNKSEKVRVR